MTDVGLDWTKPFRRRDGRPAQLLKTDVRRPNWPTRLVEVPDEDGMRWTRWYFDDGVDYDDADQSLENFDD